MNEDEKDNSLRRAREHIRQQRGPAGDDSFSAGEMESNDHELSRQIEVAPHGPLATNAPSHLTSDGDCDDNPPGWPDF